MEWVRPYCDTACEWCTYTIRADDEEGMAFFAGRYFCTENCARLWVEQQWS